MAEFLIQTWEISVIVIINTLLFLSDTTSSNGNYYGSTGDSLSRANSLNNILSDTSTGARPEKRFHRYHLVCQLHFLLYSHKHMNRMLWAYI